MPPPGLKVIALISGGKDSFFSILHCIANGHDVVALANLHPPFQPNEGQSEDIDSFMYQTVGHEIIPLYSEALGIPLFRQEILGGAVNNHREYAPPGKGQDETESLVPLLRRIKEAIPEVNAISTGAILSTYQRTRVESVALRLGLTPLSYLWQFLYLPPYRQTSLLEDMRAVGQDARIIKVASGGLNESFLWQDVANKAVMRRMRKRMGMFGGGEGGALIGEGGEFETLALDGPSKLWRKRILVEKVDMVTGEGGSSFSRLKGAHLVDKSMAEDLFGCLRIPALLDSEFDQLFHLMEDFSCEISTELNHLEDGGGADIWRIARAIQWPSTENKHLLGPTQICNIYSPEGSVTVQMGAIMQCLSETFKSANLSPSDVICSTLLLRNMDDFAIINPIYGALFTTPNPPSRVTVSCGNLLPAHAEVMLSVLVDTSQQRSGLHVQSRSYWAPANIGPYSQAISVANHEQSPADETTAEAPRIVYVAGQIPLVPASMDMVSADQMLWTNASNSTSVELKNFVAQTLLSLQHLWRIGRATDVICWTGAIALTPQCSREEAIRRAQIACTAWHQIHKIANIPSDEEEEDDEDFDVWHTQHHNTGNFPLPAVERDTRPPLPDHSRIKFMQTSENMPRSPPNFVVQVQSLPRDADIEWCSMGIASTASVMFHGDTTKHWSEQLCVISERAQTVTSIHYVSFRSVEQLCLYMNAEDGDSSSSTRRTLIVYTTRMLEQNLVEKYNPQIIPCHGIWGPGGGTLTEFAALMVMRKDVRNETKSTT